MEEDTNTLQVSDETTLINKNLSLDIGSINLQLSNLFKRFQFLYNVIEGSNILGIGIDQVKKNYDESGNILDYDEGQMFVKNGIDKLEFLTKHLKNVSDTLGITVPKTENKVSVYNYIYQERRNLTSINKFLSKLDSKYEFGDVNRKTQLYIAKEHNNDRLEQENSWIDYILTQDWINDLSKNVIQTDSSIQDWRITYLTDMINDMMKTHIENLHSNVDNFNEDLYLDFGTTDASQYINIKPLSERSTKIKQGQFIDAYNKLNSFTHTTDDGKEVGLNYCLYEIFKPIGGTSEKYIKVKVYTNGIVDIQGVVGLSDCTHVPWEYGSPEYLRSLNTGNERYIFNISLPFNDENSILWWKPDEKERMDANDLNERKPNIYNTNQANNIDQKRNVDDTSSEPSPFDDVESLRKANEMFNESVQDIKDTFSSGVSDIYESFNEQINSMREEFDSKVQEIAIPVVDEDEDEDNDSETVKYRYYKPYERERFLRWFGTTHIPQIDPDNITRKTICSIPLTSDDVQNDNFYDDANNLSNANLTKVNIDSETQISLLSLAQKSTIELKHDNNKGQYLQFVVSGHQQTMNLAFRLTGKALPTVQEINHYSCTLENITNTYTWLTKEILYLETTRMISRDFDEVWKLVMGDTLEYIPKFWMDIRATLESFVWNPSTIDLLRSREIDFIAILGELSIEVQDRKRFILEMSNIEYIPDTDNNNDNDEKFEQHEDNEIRDNFISNVKNGNAQEIKGKLSLYKDLNFFSESLMKYIYNFKTNSDITKVTLLNEINATKDVKSQLTSTLETLNALDETEYENYYGISYECTIDGLRERIETYNNLIVRLPTGTYTNNLISRNIFSDWKRFVERSLNYLVEEKHLLSGINHYGSDKGDEATDPLDIDYTRLGTDGKFHNYIEYYYTDENGKKVPLIDYDYRFKKDDEGNYEIGPDGKWVVLYDRFDFWSTDDFR